MIPPLNVFASLNMSSLRILYFFFLVRMISVFFILITMIPPDLSHHLHHCFLLFPATSSVELYAYSDVDRLKILLLKSLLQVSTISLVILLSHGVRSMMIMIFPARRQSIESCPTAKDIIHLRLLGDLGVHV